MAGGAGSGEFLELVERGLHFLRNLAERADQLPVSQAERKSVRPYPAAQRGKNPLRVAPVLQ